MKVVQLHRHSPQDAEQYTGPEGEVTVETESFALRVHDGATAGGFLTLTKAIADALYVTRTDFDTEIDQLIADLTELNDDAIEEIISNIIIAKGPVLDILTGPPGSPALGARYLIASGGTSGAYISHEDEIVEYVDDAGTAIFSGTPSKGHEVYVIDEAVKYYYNSSGATWSTTSVDGTYLTRQTAIDNAIAAKANIASPTFTGTPAAPTAAANNNSTQLATTAYVDAAVGGATELDGSLASDGYQYFPGGLLHNWGTYGGGSANPTINFSEAFPNACFAVICTPIGSSGDTDDASDAATNPALVQVQSFTDSAFTARCSRESGVRDVFHADIAANVSFHWLALGN